MQEKLHNDRVHVIDLSKASNSHAIRRVSKETPSMLSVGWKIKQRLTLEAEWWLCEKEGLSQLLVFGFIACSSF